MIGRPDGLSLQLPGHASLADFARWVSVSDGRPMSDELIAVAPIYLLHRRQLYMSACYFLNPAEDYTSIVLVDCAVNRQVGPPSVVI
jgi:hypothetical protein